ncbi:hypothetical protein IGL98_000952 [Enterococcus sp. DIV0840]|uniref:hypothetical protein n=1 Tax=unclassified Enterococcus TaxID=2608891 RepID=UPI001A8CBB3A|nr:hypothetical protein [Enterococcus sp. DIV0849a]MBO0433650.1 hypothetical protein [Enterococcus sp. DIV0849a]
MEIKSENHLREYWNSKCEEMKLECLQKFNKKGISKDDVRMIDFLEFFNNSSSKHLETLIERWKNKEIETVYTVDSFFEIGFGFGVEKMLIAKSR